MAATVQLGRRIAALVALAALLCAVPAEAAPGGGAKGRKKRQSGGSGSAAAAESDGLRILIAGAAGRETVTARDDDDVRYRGFGLVLTGGVELPVASGFSVTGGGGLHYSAVSFAEGGDRATLALVGLVVEAGAAFAPIPPLQIGAVAVFDQGVSGQALLDVNDVRYRLDVEASARLMGGGRVLYAPMPRFRVGVEAQSMLSGRLKLDTDTAREAKLAGDAIRLLAVLVL